MTTGSAGFQGQTPSVLIKRALPNPEKVKYLKLWKEVPEYRNTAPGELIASTFLNIAKPKPDSEIIDFGAGTGRGGLMLAFLGRLIVTMVDFVPDSLDEDVRNACVTQSDRIKFVEHDLTCPLPFGSKLGYCTDVMEHIPPELVHCVLQNILAAAQRCFFAISLRDDHFGATIGETLHLTVRPFEWWLNQFKELGCAIYYAQDNGSEAYFYVSNWTNVSDLFSECVVNTTQDVTLEQMRTNIARGFLQATPHQKHDAEVMILGGGPSLSGFEDEIRAKRDAGMALVCTNGTYQWCIDRGITPSAVVVADARPTNARFVETLLPNAKYLIASQVHPSVLDNLPKDRTFLFHVILNAEGKEVLNAQYGGAWLPTHGGSTVMLRTFVLLRQLGWWRFHVYGFDSCLLGEQHHAYSQPENDEDFQVITQVSLPNSEKLFSCTPWMATQAQEFVEQVRMMGDEVIMCIYGDGLIAHIIHSAAEEQPT